MDKIKTEKVVINEKKMLTNRDGGGIITLPLIEGSFFVPCQTGIKRTPEEGTGGLVAIHGLSPKLQNNRRYRTMRVKITLACTECKQRNYDTKKNKKNDPDRLEMNKYCRFCRKHTLHKETK